MVYKAVKHFPECEMGKREREIVNVGVEVTVNYKMG